MTAVLVRILQICDTLARLWYRLKLSRELHRTVQYKKTHSVPVDILSDPLISALPISECIIRYEKAFIIYHMLDNELICIGFCWRFYNPILFFQRLEQPFVVYLVLE